MTVSTVSEGRGPVPDPLTADDAAALARQYGLSRLAARPALGSYVRDLWSRRGFILTLSQSRTEARYQQNQLGRLWAVFNPLMLIVSYFFVFGLLLGTRRGVDNFIGFLSIGVIIFGISGTVISSGARSVTGNTGLVRALRFPRAVLPVSVGLTEMIANLPAFVILVLLMLVSGERLTWHWLLFPVALTLQALQIIGMALIAARVTHGTRDIANLIPLFLRLLRYTSGVFFSIEHYTAHLPAIVGHVMAYQPFALQLTLARESLLSEYPLTPMAWIVSLAWAVVLPVVGLVYFWRGEASYGRG